ncbi:hypothetical protein R3P38DRAFT_2472213, partial [Favolaschia claudopus]
RAIAFAALIVAVTVRGDIITWSGDTCDGAESPNFPCDSECVSFEGRHSFRVVTRAQHCVIMYSRKSCTGYRFAYRPTDPHCVNVDTGTAIESFRCRPDIFC